MNLKGENKMVNLPSKEVGAMLSKLPPKEKRLYSGIIQGVVTHSIYCLRGGKSPEGNVQKKGSLIGHRYQDGSIRAVRDSKGLMWLRSHRNRTDGSIGIECWCGADSRRSKSEMGVFDEVGNEPERDPLLKLLQSENGKGKPVTEGESCEVDGFSFEPINMKKE